MQREAAFRVVEHEVAGRAGGHALGARRIGKGGAFDVSAARLRAEADPTRVWSEFRTDAFQRTVVAERDHGGELAEIAPVAAAVPSERHGCLAKLVQLFCKRRKERGDERVFAIFDEDVAFRA